MFDFTVFAFAFQMFRISNVKVENGLDIFLAVFYFSTFNLKYSEFKIWFRPITGFSLRSCVLSTGGQLPSLIDGAQSHLSSPHEVVLNGRKPEHLHESPPGP
jgi:hypothetical protein